MLFLRSAFWITFLIVAVNFTYGHPRHPSVVQYAGFAGLLIGAIIATILPRKAHPAPVTPAVPQLPAPPQAQPAPAAQPAP